MEKDEITEFLERMRFEISKRIRGYKNEINLVLVAMAASDHVLYTGFPGLAKTLLTKTVAEISGCTFSRIQLTADMMPTDITGSEIWRPDKLTFEPREGPIVAQIVLADEINRAPPKTQSAFMQAMEEDAITIGNRTINLGPPFLVFATRNPIEQEGIYPLPEAQLDRFLFEIVFPYPEKNDELDIAKQGNEKPADVDQVGSPEKLISLSDFTRRHVDMSEHVYDYSVKIIRATREHEEIRLGASPRASQKLITASKAHALVVENRTLVTPEDVNAVAEPLLMPRIILRESTYEEDKDLENKKRIIAEIITKIRVEHIERN